MSTPDLAVPRPPAPARHLPGRSPLAGTTYASWGAPHVPQAAADFTETGVLLRPPLLDATLVAAVDPLTAAPADLPVEPHPVDVRSPRTHRKRVYRSRTAARHRIEPIHLVISGGVLIVAVIVLLAVAWHG